jgi:hypothetical protein
MHTFELRLPERHPSDPFGGEVGGRGADDKFPGCHPDHLSDTADRWSHPVSYDYESAIVRFCGIEPNEHPYSEATLQIHHHHLD